MDSEDQHRLTSQSDRPHSQPHGDGSPTNSTTSQSSDGSEEMTWSEEMTRVYESSHQAQAGDGCPGPSDETRSRTDSGVSLLSSPKRHIRHSPKNRLSTLDETRKGSFPSQRNTVRWSTISDDSAIDVTSPFPLRFYSNSPIEKREETNLHKQANDREVDNDKDIPDSNTDCIKHNYDKDMEHENSNDIENRNDRDTDDKEYNSHIGIEDNNGIYIDNNCKDMQDSDTDYIQHNNDKGIEHNNGKDIEDHNDIDIHDNDIDVEDKKHKDKDNNDTDDNNDVGSTETVDSISPTDEVENAGRGRPLHEIGPMNPIDSSSQIDEDENAGKRPPRPSIVDETRKGSFPSQKNWVSWSTISDDRAIDVTSPFPSSLRFYDNNPIENREEPKLHKQANNDREVDIDKDIPDSNTDFIQHNNDKGIKHNNGKDIEDHNDIDIHDNDIDVEDKKQKDKDNNDTDENNDVGSKETVGSISPTDEVENAGRGRPFHEIGPMNPIDSSSQIDEDENAGKRPPRPSIVDETRKGSFPSQKNWVSWSSISDDRAIDVTSPFPSSLRFYDNNPIENREEPKLHKQANNDREVDIDKDIPDSNTDFIQHNNDKGIKHNNGKDIEDHNDIDIHDNDINVEDKKQKDKDNNDTDENNDVGSKETVGSISPTDEVENAGRGRPLHEIGPMNPIDWSSEIDEVVNAGKRHPKLMRRFTGFFQRMCFCSHRLKSDTCKESFTNQGFAGEDFDDSRQSDFLALVTGNPVAQPLSSQSSIDPVYSDKEVISPDQTTAMDALKNVKLEKENLLDLFDSTCQQAKGMGYDVVGRVVQFANFAAAVLDSRGGILSIDALGVHLYIPPGAIPAKESPKRVYMYVQGRNHLTPYVQCGPSRFEFRKDVILILPHCAKDAVDTKFTCVKSSSSGNQTIEGGKDGNVIVKSKSILMTMRHFCGLTAYGNPKAKYMVACVFIKDTNDTNVMVRVRLFDDTKANLQEIQTTETRNGFVRVDMPGILTVKRTDPEKDVRINLMCSDTDCWEITEPKSGWQAIQHSILWRECGPDNVPSFPSKIFKASMRRSTERAPFDGYLKVFQEGREEQSVDFALTYSLNVAKATSPRQITEEQVKEICRQQIMEQLGGSVTETRLLDEETLRKLCERLDEPSPIGHDWRILPENLMGLKGHGHGWVERIKTRAASGFLTPQSPTELVLDAFFATSRESDMGNRRTLQELKRGLHSLNRPDVQFAIKVIDDQICPDPQVTNNNNKTTCTMKFEKEGEVPEIKSEQDQSQMSRSQSWEQPPQRNATAMNGTRDDLDMDRASSTSDLLSSALDPKGLDSKKRTDSAYESCTRLDTDGDHYIQ